MKKIRAIIFCNCFLIIFAQNQFAQDSLKTSKINLIDSIDNSLQNNLVIGNYELDPDNPICVDSLKNIKELMMHFKMIQESNPNLSIANEILDHNQQREFVMKSISEYYKNQPNYDLGKVGKYLGLVQKYSAFLLLFLSL